MNQINNILVALSFETPEQAEINHALTLARLYNSKITFLSVIPPLSSNEQLEISAMSPQERLDKIVLDRRISLEKLSLQYDTYNIHNHVEIGNPCEVIVQYAIQHQHDLIIIGTRPNKTLKEKLFGSTATAVLRRAPIPVLAVQPDHPQQYKRIMASVDISQDAEIINNKVITEALALSAADEGELHALSIIPSKMPAQDGQNPKMEAKKTLSEVSLKQNVDIPFPRLHIGTGDPASTIDFSVKKHDIDLLVMGMASRTGIMGFFVGNLAERVIANVDCSILIVKPDGFSA
jgi:nucleotide-binding universal stress UspA family protein